MGYDEPGAHRRRRADRPETGRAGHRDETDRSEPAERDRPPAVPPGVLGDVFDDPAHGEPGRDRIGVHLAWELVLLVAVLLLGCLIFRESPETLRGSALRSLLVAVVALGLLVVAAGLSLRTAAPNLAVGPVALAAGLHFAEQGDRGIFPALGPAALVAAAGGLLLALIVVLLHVPAWAATLAGATGVIVFIQQRPGPVLSQGDYDPSGSAFYLFAGFAATAVLSGLLGAIKTVRRLVGRFRPVGDPARRRGKAAAAVTAAGLVLSTVFAMLAGVLLAAGDPGPLRVNSGLDWTVLAVGVALLGGTSAYGRRGGIFGTLLAVVLVILFATYAEERNWSVSRYALGGGALAVGLLVTRLVEYFGRPRSATAAGRETQVVGDGATSGGWNVPRPAPTQSWPPALPTQPSENRIDPWGVERWESSPERWHPDDR